MFMDTVDPTVPSPQPLTYATPGTRPRGSGVGAGAVIMLAALGLILLGGCFMMGVMALNSNSGFNAGAPMPPKTLGQIILEIVLYLIAFTCFGGAISLITLGIRWLRKSMAG